MGGKEASRGFLYQAFASVLEALCRENWSKIYIEMDSLNDKVDISLEENGNVIKSIQVKSTINSFSKSKIVTWLKDLINDDVGSKEFELFLVGQCNEDAVIFMKSIEKYQNGITDAKAQVSLKTFDMSIIEGKKVEFKCLPYDINILQQIVRDSLHQYISKHDMIITFEQISFIAAAMSTDQMISSTHGQGIDRDVFIGELEKRIYMVADKCEPKRINLGIRSFARSSEKLDDATINTFCLLEKFEDRYLKEQYSWDEDIFKCLQEFLLSTTCDKEAYQISLDTHASIAFAAGRILDSKSGINIFPVQKTATNGSIFWNVKISNKRVYPDWVVKSEQIDNNKFDVALVLNVTKGINEAVVEYINEMELPIGRIIDCSLEADGATNVSIKDGTHAFRLADSIYNAVTKRTLSERRATLHIFASAPNAFMFFLGKCSWGFGKCILYEYDFNQSRCCTYIPSIKFIM